MIENTKEHAGVVYGIHNGDFDFRYIGKTIQPLNRRFVHHKSLASRGKKLPVYDWMRKHGVDNIHVCVIATFDEDTIHLIDEVETFHIAQCRAYNSKNLNATDGGGGCRATPETKAKISAAGLGRKVSEEAKAKISASTMGRKVSEEVRANMSAAQKGRTFSPESRERMAQAQLRNSHPRKHLNGDIHPKCPLCKETA